jgi:hypothetical protein
MQPTYVQVKSFNGVNFLTNGNFER